MIDDDDDFDHEDHPRSPYRFREDVSRVVQGHRASPWHAFEPAAPVALTGPDRLRLRWRQHALYRFWNRVSDTGMACREWWYRRRFARPSPKAQDDWWWYYEGLYKGKQPDPYRYQRLLRRWGVPDWVNPCSIGEPGYYEYHPEGLMLADAQAVLMGLQAHWNTVELEDQERARWESQGRLASACLGLALAKGQPMPILKARVAPENLALLVTEAALTNLNAWGIKPAAVLAGAVKSGLLPQDEADLLRPILRQVPLQSLEVLPAVS